MITRLQIDATLREGRIERHVGRGQGRLAADSHGVGRVRGQVQHEVLGLRRVVSVVSRDTDNSLSGWPSAAMMGVT